MNRKKMRPRSTKSSEKHSAKLRQKWWLLAVLVALLVGYFAWKSTTPATDTLPIKSSSSKTEQTKAAPSAKPLDNETNDTTLNESAALSATSSSQTLDPNTSRQVLDADAILNAPLPETDSLAKEEIDRLEDEQQRLAEQEKLAAEQLAMNKKLTAMKAEQIALLEQQIAKLEADNTDQAAVE
ncbi:hypothetical protein [Psychrobacter namhaensis]|uniref:hypothetical protein n=1 Tax=Psychrobacter namhaensis TaxID=292734 RepID=UPI0018DF709F|nr:hypothetical protein [Psychrobacter namhaensis]